MKYKKPLIFALLAFFLLLMIADHFRQLFYYDDINNEYWSIREDLTEVYEYLSSIQDPYIYIDEDYIIENNVNLTVNSRATNYILNSKAGEKLFDMGYYKIAKENNSVSFYKFKDIHGTYGIVCFASDINNSHAVSLKRIDNNWYYFKYK